MFFVLSESFLEFPLELRLQHPINFQIVHLVGSRLCTPGVSCGFNQEADGGEWGYHGIPILVTIYVTIYVTSMLL